MKDKNKKIITIFTILIICFIWGNSLLPASVSSSFSNFVTDIINFLFGGTEQTGESIVQDGLIRKIAHFTEFATLGCLVILPRATKKHLAVVLLSGMSVALIDETIQIFSDGRGSQVSDIWIDLIGFIIGSLVTYFIVNHFRKNK